MTLRTKTLLIIGLTLVALFAALYVALSTVLREGFQQVEDDLVERNVIRATEAMEEEYDSLNAGVSEYAPWNDTYAFINGEYDAYVDDNLLNSVFDNLQINAWVMVNADGEPVVVSNYDLANAQFLNEGDELLADDLTEYITSVDDSLITHESNSSANYGLLMLNDEPVMVASQPILLNDREGEPNGSLLMARYVDEAFIQELEARTQFDITVQELDNLTGSFAEANERLADPEQSVWVTPFEGTCGTDGTQTNCIAGYTLLEDVQGDPGLMMRIAIPRDVAAQGQNTLQIFIAALAGLGLIFTVMTLLILERLVLVPVAGLSKGVQGIGQSGDLSQRLEVEGEDELAALSREINQMLQNLQDSLAREKQLKAEVRQLRIEIDRVKQQQQVSEIVDTDYFQNLQQKAREIRSRKRGESTEEQP